MSFGGHALSVIKSLEQNRALYKRDRFFRNKKGKYGKKWEKEFVLKTPSPETIAANRNRNQAAFTKDRKNNHRYFLVAVAITILVFYLILI